MSSIPSAQISLSGERLQVTYLLTGSEAEAREKAGDICLEQTVELPRDLVPPGDILDKIVGRIEQLAPARENRHRVVISYAVESSDFELNQLLNLIFGNSSIKPGIRVERFDLPESLLNAFHGPRFGREGLRRYLNIPSRPLLCTAIKPMGLPPEALANLAYQFALGGIDIIKDDHGLANQPFAPFRERVARCAEAVQKANRETGMSCIYMPNVTGPADQILERALYARSAGSGGLMLLPGIAGLDAMNRVACDDRVAMPIISHPALQGSYVISADSGISHFALFGQIARLAGADGSIYPNYGGRFSFSKEECVSIIEGTQAPMGPIKPIFPTPGGGMTLSRIPELLDLYGREVIFLVGGGLHKHGPDLVENCRYFRTLVEKM